MGAMNTILGERKERTVTLLCLGLAAACIAAGLVVGISDNPPGIFLTYGGILLALMAWTNRWRSPKSHLWLAAIGLVAFFAGAFLHNAFYAVGEYWKAVAWVRYPAEALHVFFFLVAVLAAPPAFVLGVLGAVATGLSRLLGKSGATA